MALKTVRPERGYPLFTALGAVLITFHCLAGPEPVLAQSPGDGTVRSVLLYGEMEAAALPRSPSAGAWLDRERRSGRRSVPLAAGMSMLVPGAGQVYNGHLVKAGVALALEAVLIATVVSKHRAGLDAEDKFQAFAHANWNASRYGDWLNDYTDYLNDELGASIDVPRIMTGINVDFAHPELWSSADRAAVRTMFSEINRIERAVFHPETGASFSHQLPPFADQQYYELIGKYFQFAPGWNDYPAWIDGDGNFTSAIDPEQTAPDGSKPNVSNNFRSYARDHAHSQDLLRTASTFGLLVVLNHVVAAIDAAVSAKLHNDGLEPGVAVSLDGFGKPQATASLGLRL